MPSHIMNGIDCTCPHMRPVALAPFGGPSTPDVIDALYHARGTLHAPAGGAGDVPGRRSQIEITGSEGRIIDPAGPGPGPTQAMSEEVSEIEIAELLYVRNLATTAI
jgi:hypothetical protein